MGKVKLYEDNRIVGMVDFDGDGQTTAQGTFIIDATSADFTDDDTDGNYELDLTSKSDKVETIMDALRNIGTQPILFFKIGSGNNAIFGTSNQSMLYYLQSGHTQWDLYIMFNATPNDANFNIKLKTYTSFDDLETFFITTLSKNNRIVL